ncbi:DUF2280 domain-containing protein [Achromobacter xylosoxidans]|uniref:DUF2280 domain-containing protein n=1 Tax=Alcaligenes xylosoxydans xylosoxydans TaxID=85698 RepID=UPI0006C6DD31|nr:DUF2280 domain-containing protein [Achromobacter xylosoxidans]CUI29711.1 Uncharacterized conserved protein [Achromobacter xylosoxidans]
MALLSDSAKRFIVQALACYDTPSQVAEAVKDEFGLDVPRMQVAQYDPTKVAGKNLAKKWRDLFEATRKRFREEVAEIPIADQAYRLRQLGKIYERHVSRGNVIGAAGVLEQAAKEVGGAFTNRREHTGVGGGPIEQKTVVVDETQVAAAVAKLQSDY